MQIKPNKGLSDEVIEEIQDEYAIVFPEDYKVFLRKYNGGEPHLAECIDDGDFFTSIRNLFSFRTGEEYSSVEKFPLPFDYDLEFWLEHGLIPIGDNIWGDLFMMNVKNAPGRVYFSVHDEGFRLIRLANSFTDFIGLFKKRNLDPASWDEETRAQYEEFSRQMDEQEIAEFGQEEHERRRAEREAGKLKMNEGMIEVVLN